MVFFDKMGDSIVVDTFKRLFHRTELCFMVIVQVGTFHWNVLHVLVNSATPTRWQVVIRLCTLGRCLVLITGSCESSQFLSLH